MALRYLFGPVTSHFVEQDLGEGKGARQLYRLWISWQRTGFRWGQVLGDATPVRSPATQQHSPLDEATLDSPNCLVASESGEGQDA